VRMPPPQHVHAILDPASQPPGPTLASLRPATPELLRAARDAFGFSGGSPTEAERTAAIGKLGDVAPEKLLWSDLRSLDPDAHGFLERARTLGEQDSQLVDAMRTRSRLPSGVGADPAADFTVVLLTNEAYVSRRSVRVEPGGTLRVEVINRDGFAHRDIAGTAPYMHNGRLKTLREVVEFYRRESTIAPLELTEGEIDDLVEYLKSL
jgi:hypothetical protein